MSASNDQGEGFVSRIRVIEEQPLATRASAYASVHDELARKLDAPIGRSGEPRE